ncbi:MAG: hypothetical protein COA79_21595 [Planctomycetota bacterium]|nr:MAG: hypothetical protein COA79_21595 [Planctomycetota bacterium]
MSEKNRDPLLLNAFETYELLSGQKNLSIKIVKSRLSYLRKYHGLNGIRVGRDFYYSENQIKNFIKMKEEKSKHENSKMVI